MKLTADDRLDIIELPGRYADALDLRQPESLRQVFTVDAVWEVVGAMRLEGLDAIMAFMGRDDVHPGAHIMTNVYIASVEPQQADASPLVRLSSRGIYPVGPSSRENPTAVFYGRYDDDVVRTADGWRIRHRRYRYGV